MHSLQLLEHYSHYKEIVFPYLPLGQLLMHILLYKKKPVVHLVHVFIVEEVHS
jgi:hypothetical protein